MHVAVIGAGITGLASCWSLLQAGHRVSLVDAAPGPAMGTSSQNGAQLSYAFVAPLASPGTLKQLPQLLVDPHSPLRFRPGLSWAQWRWCLQFLAACNTRDAALTTSALLSLAALSRERFADWRATVPAERIAFARNGKLVVYRSEASLESARRQVALQAAEGPPQQVCDAAECLRLEPALQGMAGPLAGGVLTPSEEVADCALVCHALAEQLADGAGFTAHWNTRVTGWQLAPDRADALRCDPDGRGVQIEADAYVVAGGVAAPRLLQPLGMTLPVVPLKGYSIEVDAQGLRRCPTHSITDAAAKIVFAPLDLPAGRHLRVAGMAELVGHDLTVDPRRIAELRDATAHLFGLDETATPLRPWAGLRPATPTGRPAIGRTRRCANVFVNAGQGALGFTLAFGSAELLRAALEGRTAPLPSTMPFRAGLAA